MKAKAELSQIPISIDTFDAQVAEAAVQAGAHMVNDVSGGIMDPNMHATVSNPLPTHVTPPTSLDLLPHPRHQYTC